MKMTFKQIVFSAGLFASLTAQAGNEDRVGSAGASQLLVNPWARSSAIGDASYANSNGLEATYMNIAGLAFTDKTQLKYNLVVIIFTVQKRIIINIKLLD